MNDPPPRSRMTNMEVQTVFPSCPAAPPPPDESTKM